jgi:hypothetical protein
MHEVFEEAVARGLLQLHAKHEHAAKVNDINVRFDSSSKFRGMKINCLATSRNVIFAQGAEQDPSWAG